MPEPTPPASRADLEKLTKAELVDLLQSSLADGAETRDALARTRDALAHARDRAGARPEDAFVVGALLDLHRASLHANRPSAQRFLDAALKAGTPLADAILGDAPTE